MRTLDSGWVGLRHRAHVSKTNVFVTGREHPGIAELYAGSGVTKPVTKSTYQKRANGVSFKTQISGMPDPRQRPGAFDEQDAASTQEEASLSLLS
jgi:hypothetical protein